MLALLVFAGIDVIELDVSRKLHQVVFQVLIRVARIKATVQKEIDSANGLLPGAVLVELCRFDADNADGFPWYPHDAIDGLALKIVFSLVRCKLIGSKLSSAK